MVDLDASAVEHCIQGPVEAGWWRDALKTGDCALVLEMANTVAGYATLGSSRQRGPFQGEIYELYLDPIYQGLGLGEHLFEGCRHALLTCTPYKVQADRPAVH